MAKNRKKTATKATKTTGAKPSGKLARELAGLAKLQKTALRARYKEVFGHESRSHNSNQLRAAIARQLQEQAAEGRGSSKRGFAVKAESSSASQKKRDPRLPPVGTVMEREHNGTVHKVKVLEDGFEYAGTKYGSLSAIAKDITGAIWNGYLWMGLIKRPSAKKGAADAA